MEIISVRKNIKGDNYGCGTMVILLVLVDLVLIIFQ